MLNVLRIPVVYTEHGMGLLSGRQMDKWIYLYLFRPIQAFIAISETMAKVMRSINPRIAERVVTVQNGIELDLIDAQSIHQENAWPAMARNAGKRVGIVARLVEEKGVDLFIDAAAELLNEYKDLVFIIIGDGPLRQMLESRARNLGINEKVLFMGYRSDAVRWLKGFDVYLFTSKIEPFGLVLLEAMAAKVPIVAAHIKSAVPEIIENNVNGIIVKGAEPEILAKNVRNILEQPGLAKSLADNARKTVESRYTMAVNARGIDMVYKKILAN